MKNRHAFLFTLIFFLLVFTFYQIGVDYPDLPGRVPTHFNEAGDPDAWGSKTTILLFPGIQSIFALLAVLVYKYPNYANIPSTIALRHLPEEKRKKAYELIRDLVLIVMSITSLLMCYLTRENLQVAKGMEESISTLPIWIILLGLAPPIVYYTIKMKRIG